MWNKLVYRWKVINELKDYSKGVHKFFYLLLIINLAIMGIAFVEAYLYKIFVDDVIIERQIGKIYYLVLAYSLFFTFRVVLNFVATYSKNNLINTTMFRIKYKVWKGIFRLDFREYETQSIGDRKMRLDDDIEKFSEFAENQTVNYLISCFTVVITGVTLVWIEWRLAILGILAIPTTLLIDHIISERERRINEDMRKNDEQMTSWLHATVQGWKEVKSLNLQKRQEMKFIDFLHRGAIYNSKWINFWVARVLVIPRFKNEFIMQFGVYFIGGFLVSMNQITAGELLVFIVYYNMLSENIVNVSLRDSDLLSSMPYFDRVLIELRRKGKDISKDYQLENINDIDFKNVTFSYSECEKNILEHFNIEIRKGDRIAIVGESGCGKSTFIKLLLGLEKPTEGNIVYSKSINQSEIDIDSILRKVCCVMQENMLFNTTIRENLLYADPNATEVELLEACKKAYILDFIQTLQEGMETVIGEKGVKLSGGQRQRIILARGFLQEADVYIFDEATSALDQYSESIIHDAISNISEDKIIIIVSHRESSLKLCNRRVNLNG
jgi:ABC-type bacteriocin/lantibiotic exporter with double-glycine peptidase domain